MEEIILETKELCKQYHKQTVLKNINMRIPKGCVYGLLGANGRRKIDIDEILCGMTRAAAGKKQTIQFECENLPKWICVNEKLLIRSWENLVYNAIEYTPQGGMIRICISEGKEQLEISVEDERSMGKTADCERIPEISDCKSLKNDIEYKRNLIRKERKTDRCYLYTIRNVPHVNVPKSGWMSIRFLMKNEISKRITRHWKS